MSLQACLASSIARSLFFVEFSLREGVECFLHDSAGFVSYCFALRRGRPAKRLDEREIEDGLETSCACSLASIDPD
jgi:hypothetical protein